MYDVAIIGGGHNGLVCACYLAKAGLRVAVLEKRPIVGGAVCTQTDLIEGCRIDVGSSVHIMIHLTPIVKDLELAGCGLEYIEMDPWAYYPVLGTDTGISFYRDLEKTCESISRFSYRDAMTYKKFVLEWQKLNEGVFETFLAPPSPGKLFWTIFKQNVFGNKSDVPHLEMVRKLMAPYGQLVEEMFENEHLRTALLWLSAQSGPAPSEVASGDMLGWNAMIHKSGAKRAKGGSGMLTQALAKRLEEWGGEVILDATVTSIEKGNRQRWRVNYHSTAQQTCVERRIEAKAVVGACHVQTLFLDLIKETPADLKKRIETLRVGNGFGMMVRHLVDELPIYGSEEHPNNTITEHKHIAFGPADVPPLSAQEIVPEIKLPSIQPYHSAMQLLCPNKDYLQSSHCDFSCGRPPHAPSVVAMTFSAIDPTLAPEGKHLLYTWGQYHPYELKNGEHWDSIREREADKLYELVCRYAPNMRGKLIDRYVQTPLDIERTLGLLRANVMHLEMSIDQMFCFRPLPELSTYTTPLPGLYLTGASTHPGGGVFGASGYNTAQVVIKDWGKLR